MTGVNFPVFRKICLLFLVFSRLPLGETCRRHFVDHCNLGIGELRKLLNNWMLQSERSTKLVWAEPFDSHPDLWQSHSTHDLSAADLREILMKYHLREIDSEWVLIKTLISNKISLSWDNCYSFFISTAICITSMPALAHVVVEIAPGMDEVVNVGSIFGIQY